MSRCSSNGRGDLAERNSIIGWHEFDVHVEQSYRVLKARQTRLLRNAL
jgi:hypothetical protein